MNRHWLRLACLIGFLSSLPALAQNGAPTSRTAIQFQNAGVNVMYGSGYFKFNVTGSGCSASNVSFKFNVTGSGCSASNVSGVFTLNCSGGGSQVYPSAGVACSTGSAWTACSVTNDVQTKAAVMPNTAPSAGQFPVGNLAGTAYAPQSLSGDCALASTGAITCTKTNGTGFGTGATATIANYAPLASPQFTGTPAGPNGNLTQTICSGTISLGTSAIASGAAATTITQTCTGLASSDNISLDFNASPLAVTGYVPSASGMLTNRLRLHHQPQQQRRKQYFGHSIVSSHHGVGRLVCWSLKILFPVCLDAAGANFSTTGATPAGPTLSTTGSNDLVIQADRPSTSPTAVGTNYTEDTNFALGVLVNVAYWMNATSNIGAAMTWTVTTGHSVMDAIASKENCGTTQAGAFLVGP